MIIIPCVKNKCILYPVCKHKKEIYCDDMYSWYALSSGEEISNRWQHIHRTFPNIEALGQVTIIPPRTIPYIIAMKRL